MGRHLGVASDRLIFGTIALSRDAGPRQFRHDDGKLAAFAPHLRVT
jgi:hypothetical protein